MKAFCRIFLFFAIIFFGLASLYAQEWEQVGWQGGIISIKAQLGNTLIGQGYSVNLAGYTGVSATPLTEIYRSTDEGKSWKIFRAGLPPCTWNVYIKTSGEYVYLFPDRFQNTIPAFDNFGVYTAQEKDTEWTHLSFSPILGSPPFSTYSPDIDPVMFFGNNTILVQFPGDNIMSGYQGLYLSTNNGKTWEIKSLPGIKQLGGIETHLRNKRIFATGWSSDDSTYKTSRAFFLRSDDAGNTWKQLSYADTNYTGPPLFLNDSLLFYFHIFDSTSYRSTDGGAHWVTMNLPLDSLSHNSQSIRFFFKIGSRLYLAEDTKNIHQAYTSNDDGFTWQRFPALDTSYFNATQIYQVGSKVFLGQDGLFFQTDTELTTLTLYQNSNGLKSNSGHILLFVGGDTIYSSFSNEFNNVYYSDSIDVSFDNGNTWYRRLFSKGHYIPSKLRWVKNGTTLFATGEEEGKTGSILLVSHNGGISWQNEIKLPFHRKVTQIFSSGDTVIINASGNGNPTLSTNFFVSIDAGKSWIRPFIPGLDTNDNISISFDNRKIVIFQSLLIFESTDLGKTWTTIVPNGFTSKYIDQRFFVKRDNMFLLQTPLRDTEGYKLLISSDGGESFFADSLVKNDSSIIFPIINDSGILFSSDRIKTEQYTESIALYSPDDGWHWKQIGSILPDDPNIFVGSDYIFMSGIHELWRIPKSVLSTLKVPEHENISFLFITCFPNPAITSTYISYSLPQNSNVMIQAFDVMGRKVASIASGARDAGSYNVEWDTRALPAGTYFIRLTSGGESKTCVVEVAR